MKNWLLGFPKSSPRHFWILLITILILAGALRARQYWIIPLSDETADELAWTWLGTSLITQGEPISWSYYPQYREQHIYREGVVDAPLVRPAVDHPPLFSFIPGTVQALTGGRLEIPSRKVIRFPMIVLGVLNVALLALLARRLLTPGWALVATAIYATVPLFVFSSRLVVSENLMTTWILALLLLLERWLTTGNTKKPWLERGIILVSMAAILTKISGVVLPISVIAYGLIAKKERITKLGLFGLGGGVLALLAYMSLFDLGLFLSVQGSQAGRELGFTTLFQRFLIHPTVAQMVYFDGWLLLGLFAFVILLARTDLFSTKTAVGERLLVVFSLLTVAFILVTSGEFTYHGWYSYTLFPLLSIAIALLAQEAYEKNTWLAGFIWILLLPNIGNLLGFLGLQDQIGNQGIRLLYGLGFLPVLAQILGKESWKKTGLLALGVVVIVINILAVWHVNEFALREANNLFYFQIQQ